MHRGRINPFNELKTFFYIWKFFKKERPDIVHLVTIKPYLYGGVISRLLSIRAVVSAISGFGTLFISKNLKFKILRLLLSPIFKFSFNHSNQMIIVQNESDLKILIKFGILNLSKVKIFKGSGVKLENFVDLKEPSGIPTVCFAARLLRDKGIYEFISAARILNERGIQARFFIAGDLDVNNPTGLNFEEYNET
jgi:glycosyltransferase involved in cell wall biosynthesis